MSTLIKGAFEDVVDGVKVRKSVEGIEIGQIVESIGGDSDHVKTSLNLFSPLQKVLFHLVFQSIIPRSQHRNEANHLDAILMYCLEHKIPINFPSLMVQHLAHCIEHKLKIGYGNLLITIFKSFKIPHDKEFITMQTNHFIQPKTLKSWGLCVKDGKTMWLEYQKNKVGEKDDVLEEQGKEEETDVMMMEATEGSGVPENVTVKVEKIEETSNVTRGRGRGRGGMKRTSLRLVPKKKAKKDVAEFFALDDEEDDKEEPKKEGEKVEETAEEEPITMAQAVPTFGFGAFSSFNIIEELKEIKESLKKGEETQLLLISKLDTLNDKISQQDVANADSHLVLKELQSSTAMLTRNQEELKAKLDDMMIEAQHDDDGDDAA